MLQKAMGELTKVKEASAVAKAAQKEHEQTKRNLTKVLNELARLKAAASKHKPFTEQISPAQESEEESDSEMDIDPLNSKRRRPSDEESSEDAGTNNKNDNNLIDLTDINGSAQVDLGRGHKRPSTMDCRTNRRNPQTQTHQEKQQVQEDQNRVG